MTWGLLTEMSARLKTVSGPRTTRVRRTCSATLLIKNNSLQLSQSQRKLNLLREKNNIKVTLGWRLGVVASVIRRMNDVTVHWARLVLGWVTVFGRVYHHGV